MNKILHNYLKDNRYEFTSLDLFCGPGGLATGLKWAGIYPLIAIEWTDSTALTYCYNHDAELFDLEEYLNNPEYINQFLKETYYPVLIKGDIKKVSNELILELLESRYGLKSVEIVTGGAPCESFSLAGKRKHADPRDNLFAQILRISKFIEPEIIVFENVKGLLSKKMGENSERAIEYVCNSFENKDIKPYYTLASKDEKDFLLNAVNYGVPQNRDRILLIAFKNNEKLNNFNYPSGIFPEESKNPYITVSEAIYDLPTVQTREEVNQYNELEHYSSDKQKWYLSIMRNTISSNDFNNFLPEHFKIGQNGIGNYLSSHKGPGHTRKKLKLLENIRKGESMKSAYERICNNGEIDDLRELFPKTIYGSRNRRLIEDKPSFTVTSHCLDEILHPFLNRAITPREAARLQSFPDWYEFKGPYVAFHSSPVQDRYEQIGDAVPPLLAYAIGIELKKALS